VLRVDSPGTPERLILESEISARRSRQRATARSSSQDPVFSVCPDLYVAHGRRFTEMRRISDINPQQQEFLWGTVELFAWKTTDNAPLQGLLYKPENFDPKQKYPMLVYYYEREFGSPAQVHAASTEQVNHQSGVLRQQRLPGVHPPTYAIAWAIREERL